MLEFFPTPNAEPAPGLVLRLQLPEVRYLRVTHVFNRAMYVMWVGEPPEARFARRPIRKSASEIEQLVTTCDGTWGHLSLPSALSTPPAPNSEREQALDSAWDLISPLVDAFDKEANLERSGFSVLIRTRAEETNTNFATLFKTVLRYYYFGRSRFALLKLPPGTKPGSGTYAAQSRDNGATDSKPKRRGRKSIIAKELGENDFIVSDEDIDDMVRTFKGLLGGGPTYKSHAHEDYLAGAFRRRHPEMYAEYISGKRPEPVTYRQYAYYVDANAQLSEDLAKNLRTNRQNTGYLGSLYAAGPGEVYEIDSTGGRLHLVSAGDSPVVAGKPTIYLIIDRWSRFVVAAYLSLRPPSYEEVRYALLIAFTSRERRFRAIGVDVDDERWPVGRMPAVICPDRGAEYLSESMEQSVVKDLRIELTPLPPYCPDGKAIVERLIREIKRRMAATRMKGTYADRPMDPETKRAARRAESVAIHSLSPAYAKLIELIVDHNNRPHTALKRRRVLAQAGVMPTPTAAYLWGLKHISGLRRAAFSDADYKRLLLATDTASIGSGVLRYRGRPYIPKNEVAIDIAERSSNRAKQVGVRVDKTDPHEVFMVTSQGVWATFGITRGGESEIAGLTLDEEEVLASQTSLLWARADHESRVERVASKNQTPKAAPRANRPATKVSRKEQQEARANETAAMKRALTDEQAGGPSHKIQRRLATTDDWKQIEEEERLRALEAVRKHRRKR